MSSTPSSPRSFHASPPRARRARGRGVTFFAIAAAAALTLGLTACSSDDNAADATSTTAKATTTTAAKKNGDSPIANAITITSPGMSFEVSGTLRPGVAAITFKNTDVNSHMLAVARVKDGVTLDQIKTAAMSDDQSAQNKLLLDGTDAQYGTPAPVGPGQESTVIAPDLKAGTYAILCFFTDDSGTPHVAMGMINEFKVTGEETTEKPSETGAITVDDKQFTMPSDFNGKGTFNVTNTGTKPHDLQIVRIDPGATLESYFSAVGSAMNGGKSVDSAKGGVMVGGVSGLNPGQSAWLVLDLPAGHYGYLSTEDAQSGPPAQVGEFTVS